MTDRDLYSRLLLAKGHGYPLSYPQPPDDLPPESRAKGIEIGDVGVLTSDGAFDVIFNICRAPDDPVNRFGVPVGFETVHLGPGDISSRELYHRPGSHVSNTSVNKRRLDVDADLDNVFSPVGAGAVVEISTSSKQAAVLLMPEGASRINVRFLDIFRQQALKHAENWYAFLKSLGCMVENGELYLVTGADKSSSWSVAAGENHSQDGSISLKLKAAQIGSAGSSYAWQWETAGGFADSGPRRRPGEESSTQNQTVFLRGFRIAIHSLVWKKVSQAIPVVDSKPLKMFSRRWFSSFVQSASLGTRAVSRDTTAGQNTGSAPRDEEYDVEYSPGIPRPYHPADAINKHLLASSPSGIIAAVTHDDEWVSALRENDETVPTESELIRRVSEQYTTEFTSDGAYLCGSNIDQSAPSSRDTRAQAPLVSAPGPVSGLPKAERHSVWLTILFALPLILFFLAFALFLMTIALSWEEEDDILPRSHWALHASETFVVCSLSFFAALLLQAGLLKFGLTRLTCSMRRLEARRAIVEDCDIIRLDALRCSALRLQQATFEIRRSRWIHTTPLNCRTELELFLDTCRTVQEIEQALKMTQSSDEMQALHRRKKLEDDRRLGVGSDLAGGGSGRGVEKKKVVGEVTTGNMDSDPEDRDEQ